MAFYEYADPISYPATMSKKQIIRECENGSYGYHLCYPTEYRDFKEDIIFHTEDEAWEYLDNTPPRICSAVRYYDASNVKPTAEMTKLKERIEKVEQRLDSYRRSYYANPDMTIKTIKCKSCGSVLARAYCGKSYHNYCPICGADLRPQTTLEREAKDSALLKELKAKYKKLEKDFTQKSKKKAKVYWLVQAVYNLQ